MRIHQAVTENGRKGPRVETGRTGVGTLERTGPGESNQAPRKTGEGAARSETDLHPQGAFIYLESHASPDPCQNFLRKFQDIE